MRKITTAARAAFITGLLSFAILTSACSGMFYQEYNPDSSEDIDIVETGHRLVFGTSTGDTSENWVELEDGGETVHLYARNPTNNAGKIAGSEDGITYFFREVDAGQNFRLSADIRVLSYGGVGVNGETTSNGQEGFGLMARDYIPQYPGYTIADLIGSSEYRPGSTGGSSNMVMIGGIKRGVRSAMRMGVVAPDGDPITDATYIPDASASSIQWLPEELADYSPYPTLEERPDFPLVDGVYRFTLEKTNSGFRCTIVPPADKGGTMEYFYAEPDILTAINEDHYYVGFFAARAAEILASSITYSESNSADDAPREELPPEVIQPSIEIQSPSTHGGGTFKLRITANVKGYLSVRQNGWPVEGAEYIEGQWLQPASASADPYAFFDVPVYELDEGENAFQVIFHPDAEAYPLDGSILSDNAPVQRTFLVEKRSYFDASTPIYVAPLGKSFNTGTASSPLDIQTAIDFVQPGQTIIMQDGVYEMLSLIIPRYNDGTFYQRKRLVAENRDEAIIDFSRNLYATGAVLQGNFWDISGIHIRNTPDKVKGFVVMGRNNIVEWVKTYGHGDTGLQISGRSWEPSDWWPSNNTIRYCESYNNMDAAQTDADGFAAKLTVGEGNRFEWCVSHNNGDDGWDLFTKKETGPIGVVTIENCVSYQNGLLMDGTQTRAGRNGFKLGGEGLAVPHMVTNSVAFQNGAHGFTSNSNPAVQLSFCTSFDNGGRFNAKFGADSRNFSIYNGTDAIVNLQATMEGLLSLYTDPSDDDGYRREDKIHLTTVSQGIFWQGDGGELADFGRRDGTNLRNVNGDSITVADHVLETAPPLWNADGTTAVETQTLPDVGEVVIGFIRRNGDGHFDLGDFLLLDEPNLPVFLRSTLENYPVGYVY